jgi:TolA-binding protein
MMTHAPKSLIAIVLLLGGTTLAQAACPPAAGGNTAEAIAANQQRLVCLNQEVAGSAVDRQRDMQIRDMQKSIDTLSIERRFDKLPNFQPPRFEPPRF